MRLLALVLPVCVLACRQGSSLDGEWSEVARLDESTPVTEKHGPTVVGDGELKSYLPDRIGDRPAGEAHGSTMRVGDRVLSEVSRSYSGEGRAVELRLSDARLSPQVVHAIAGVGGDQQAFGGEPSRLVLPGAVGYSRYDEGERMALAQVVIAGRFVASATVSGAKGAEDAADVLRAVDTLRLARVAQAE
jgi:hypothetical protein